MVRKIFPLLIIFILTAFIAGCGYMDKGAWKTAVKENTVESYREYLKKHPVGKYVKEAKTALCSLIELFSVSKDDKMGYIDKTGKILIEPKYDYVGEFSEDMALINLGGKWGFINKMGEIIVEPKYDEIADFSEGLALVKDGDKWGFINKEGKFVIPSQFNDAWSFYEGMALVKIKEKWGFITPDGKIAIEPSYKWAYSAEGSDFFLLLEDGSLLNPRTVVISEDNVAYLLEISKDKIERLGKIKLTMYKDYRYKLFSKKNFEWLSHEDSLGFSQWGYKIGRTTYHGIENWVDDFFEKHARVIIDNKWGYIDKTGTIKIKPQFDYCSRLSDGVAIIEINGKLGVIEESGKMIVKPRFIGISSMFSEGLAAVTTKDKWGYIDRKGKMVISEQFDEAKLFKEGLASVKVKAKWGYIDKSGTLIINTQFEEAKDFSDGLAGVKVGDKWGFIDKSNTIVIKPQFHDVGDFYKGLARVKIDDKYGYIDKTGKFIWQSTR